MVTIPTLHTPNLILRPLVPADAPLLHRIYQTKDILRYFPNPTPPPLERVNRFIGNQLALWEQYGYGYWAVVPAASGELAGWVNLQYLTETDETEVGYLLDQPQWGKGYATEAARAALQFGFERFDFPQIIALVHSDNLASLRVAAKCGFVVIERKTYWGLELVRHTVTKHSLKLA
jgi:[ribosomal protein S5]-alanine N-acetyltransferase